MHNKRIYVETNEYSRVFRRDFTRGLKLVLPYYREKHYSWLRGLLMVCLVVAGFAFFYACMLLLAAIYRQFHLSERLYGILCLVSIVLVAIGTLVLFALVPGITRKLMIQRAEKKLAEQENLPVEQYSVKLLGQGEDPVSWFAREDLRTGVARYEVTPIDENSRILLTEPLLKRQDFAPLRFAASAFLLNALIGLPALLMQITPSLNWLWNILQAAAFVAVFCVIRKELKKMKTKMKK